MGTYVKVKNDELMHYGVLGMRWGHSKKGYRSNSIRSALARRSNDKTDAGFNDWKSNDQKKQVAIGAGKNRNELKRAYDADPKNKQLKAEYKTANKEYKSALGKNTTYRKGVVKQEVGSDMSRKYLSEAKKLKKQIDAGKGDATTKKQYQKLMNKYDVERASARRAVAVASKRSQKKASMKRAMTMSAKAAATTAVVGAGGYYVNKHLISQGKQPINVSQVVNLAKKAKEFMGYF
jgi:hypothetical protein